MPQEHQEPWEPGGVPVSIHTVDRDRVRKGESTPVWVGLRNAAAQPFQVVRLEYDHPEVLQPPGEPAHMQVRGGEIEDSYMLRISSTAASCMLTITARSTSTDPGVVTRIKIIDDPTP